MNGLGATQSTVNNSSPESSELNSEVASKSAKIRDLCVDLLKLVRNNASTQNLSQKLQQIAPQVERHVAFQRKVGKWHFAMDFDAIGTELFNVSTRMARSTIAAHDKTVTCHLRVAAVLILECGRRHSGDQEFAKRLLKASLKTAKLCQDCDVLPLAHKILERAAEFQEEVSQMLLSTIDAEEKALICCLRADYHIARIQMARKEENHQLMEYVLAKAIEPHIVTTLDSAKYLAIAELVFEFGSFNLGNRNTDKAIVWLRRCHDLVVCRDEESFTDIRVATLQNLVKAHLLRGDDHDLDSVSALLDFAAEDYPVAAWLYLLRAEYISKKYPSDVRPLLNVLESTIRIVQMSNSVFQGVMSRIHDIYKIDLLAACQLVDLLLPKIVDVSELVEKALVTRVWLSTKFAESDHTRALKNLEKTFAELETKLLEPFGLRATSAAQVLLWKVSDSLFLQKKYQSAIRWCSTCRAPILRTASTTNEGKIIRRIVLCYIELGDSVAAQQLLLEMPQEDFKLALTRYVSYRAKLPSSADDVILEDVRALISCEDFTLPMLYHCAIEATDLGRKFLAKSLLELVLTEAQSVSSNEDLRLPVLLRCIIKMTRDELQSTRLVDAPYLETLCTYFEMAAKLVATEELMLKNGFNVRELEWFSKNAHNFAVGGCSKWPVGHVQRMISCTKAFLRAYPKDLEEAARQEWQDRNLLCHYLAICTNLLTSRAETATVRKTELLELVHSDAREYRGLFHSRFTGVPHVLPGKAALAKLATILVFEFEACAKLAQWDELNKLVEVADTYQLSSLPLNCMADLILTSAAPLESSFEIINALTNATLRAEDRDIPRLSKWLRVMFTLCLSQNEVILHSFSTKLLCIIKDNFATYPVDEIQWLAARSFNHAVDLHTAGNLEGCHKMCEVAMNIGNYTKDEVLKLQIQRNYQSIINSL